MEEIKKREVPKKRLLLSLVISIMLFIGFFTFGYFISYSVHKNITEKQSNLLDSFLEIQLQKELIKHSCNDFGLKPFSEELMNMASYMFTLEEKLGKNDPYVIEQKKTYSLIQIQHMLLVEEEIENCNSSKQILIFFYSNSPQNIKEAEDLGYIISIFRQKYDNIYVYSFDYDLRLSILESLKELHGIKEPNSLVYAGRYFKSVKNIDELISFKEELAN